MKRAAILVILGLVVVGGITTWLVLSSKSDRLDLVGTLTLQGKTTHDGEGWCAGGGGYSDITEGAPVTIYDASGTIIATGSLGRGDDHHWNVTDSEHANLCWFGFSVPSVPSTNFYQIEVGHRGKVSYSREDFRAGLVALTLGSG